MMHIYRKHAADETLLIVDDVKPGDWIDLVRPTPDEMGTVLGNTTAVEDHMLFPLDDDERSRLDIEPGSRLFIIRIPIKSEKEGGRLKLSTIPLGIILAEEHVITVCLEEETVLHTFRDDKVRSFATSKTTRFLLQVLSRTIVAYLRHLASIEREMQNIETGLFSSIRNEEIIELMELQKDLIYFRTGIVGNGNVLARLLQGKVVKLYEEDEDLLDDLIVENQQCIEMANIFSNILQGTMETYSSVVSNNLNTVMKILTSITIILSLPTLVSSIYGMNVSLPLDHTPYAFWIIMLICLLFSAVAVVYFIKQEWL